MTPAIAHPIAHRARPLALAVATAAAAMWFANCTAPRAHGAARPAEANIQDLGDDKLMGELAGRGLDSLLNHVFDTKHIPPEQRNGIKTLQALRQLTDPAQKLSDTARQRIARVAGDGMTAALPQINNLADLQKYAGILLDAEVTPDAELLEFWGENPQLQTQLKPSADAVCALLNKASKVAAEERDKLAQGLNNLNNVALANKVDELDNLSRGAAYHASLFAYARALSIDSSTDAGKAARQAIADEALKQLIDLDNNDSGVQSIVRMAIAQLEAVKGEFKDANTIYTSIVTGNKTPLPDSATGNNAPAQKDTEKTILPAPTADQVFNARYFSIVGLLETKDIPGAQKAQAELAKWEATGLDAATQKYYGAAMDLLQYRILNTQAAAAANPAEKQGFIDQGDAALNKLKKDHPEFAGIIEQQLISRMAPDAPVATMDPLLLQALENRGLGEARKGENEKVDAVAIQRAIAAAQEVLGRKDRTGIDAKLVDDSKVLIPNMYKRLSEDAAVPAPDKIKYAVEAGNGYLTYAQEAFATNPSRATEAFKLAGGFAFDLKRTADGKPGVTELYDRFLPIAIAAPFNHKELAYPYGKRLRSIDKSKEAAVQFRQVAKTDPNYFRGQYYLMLCLKDELGGKLDPAERGAVVDEIGKVGDNVKELGAASKDPVLHGMSAQSSLIAAEIAVNEETKKDPKRALSLLSDFEAQVKGLPADRQKALLNEALFVRVNAHMDLGQFDQATNELVSLLEKTEPGEAIGLVRSLLDQLDTAYVSADLVNDTARMRSVAKNEARLTGDLATWAGSNKDPKIRKFAYSYAVYDAKTKRIAGTLDEDPTTRTADLKKSLQLYTSLQSPENTKLYMATLDPKKIAAGDYSPTDLQVDVGIAFTNFELHNWEKAQEGLGALIGANRLGGATQVVDDHGEQKVKDNDLYWEATYKLLKSNIEIAKARKDETIMNSEKKYLKELLNRGGIPFRWQDEFESARADIIPDFKVAPPATQPVVKR